MNRKFNNFKHRITYQNKLENTIWAIEYAVHYLYEKVIYRLFPPVIWNIPTLADFAKNDFSRNWSIQYLSVTHDSKVWIVLFQIIYAWREQSMQLSVQSSLF